LGHKKKGGPSESNNKVSKKFMKATHESKGESSGFLEKSPETHPSKDFLNRIQNLQILLIREEAREERNGLQNKAPAGRTTRKKNRRF